MKPGPPAAALRRVNPELHAAVRRSGRPSWLLALLAGFPQQSSFSTTLRAPEIRATPIVVTELAFTPGKGFATELYAAMKTLGSATPQQAADALLASGAYQRVAPKVAELRPVKPVETLLKQWLAKGVVTAK